MGLGRDAGNLDFGVPLTVALTLPCGAYDEREILG